MDLLKEPFCSGRAELDHVHKPVFVTFCPMVFAINPFDGLRFNGVTIFTLNCLGIFLQCLEEAVAADIIQYI